MYACNFRNKSLLTVIGVDTIIFKIKRYSSTDYIVLLEVEFERREVWGGAESAKQLDLIINIRQP